VRRGQPAGLFSPLCCVELRGGRSTFRVGHQSGMNLNLDARYKTKSGKRECIYLAFRLWKHVMFTFSADTY
jgi:hypothetical protein